MYHLFIDCDVWWVKTLMPQAQSLLKQMQTLPLSDCINIEECK
jgi:hypothetical protein